MFACACVFACVCVCVPVCVLHPWPYLGKCSAAYEGTRRSHASAESVPKTVSKRLRPFTARVGQVVQLFGLLPPESSGDDGHEVEVRAPAVQSDSLVQELGMGVHPSLTVSALRIDKGFAVQTRARRRNDPARARLVDFWFSIEVIRVDLVCTVCARGKPRTTAEERQRLRPILGCAYSTLMPNLCPRVRSLQ